MKDVKELRNELKLAGYNQRMVSIRVDYPKIHATIRSEKVNSKIVENILQTAEKIHRCEVTGEILSGGNTFVDVSFSDKMENFFIENYAEVAQKIWNERQIPGESGAGKVDGWMLFFNRQYGNSYTLRNENGGDYYISNNEKQALKDIAKFVGRKYSETVGTEELEVCA